MNDEQITELKNLENLKAQLQELKKSKSLSKLAIARTTADIGYSFNNLDQFEEALDYCKESLEKYKEYNLADNYQSEIADIYMCMGTIYDRQGNYSKALNCLQMSLDICSKKQSNDSNRANVLNSIGLVYMNLGKDDKALDYLNESLRIKRRIFDPDSPEIATAYGNIGIVYKKKGELDDALNYLNLALRIKENTKPINYPSKAGTLNNIGLVYFNQGKFDDALNYYQSSLEIREKRQASNHPEIGRTLVNIGDLYFVDEDYEKALEYYNKSHYIYKNFPLPANHPDIGRVLNKIGQVYKEERNYDEALKFFNDSLDVYQKSELRSDHSDIVETYNIIGLVYKEQGQYEQALKYLKDSGQISACLRQIRKDRKDRDKEDGLTDAKKQFKKHAPIEVISDDLLGKTLKERYVTVKILGSGTYGQVYKIHDSKESKIEKVVKITKNDLVAENELDLLNSINHENIVKYFHSFHMRRSDQLYLCIIIEYCSKGDLRKLIANKTKFTEKQMFDWTLQTTKALIHLHSNKIIHRDVKPENMLLSENETIKLSDFGLATLTSDSSFSSTYAGTRSYMSPELYKCVYKDKNYKYTYNTDIWSLGCVLYELMFLKKAFPQGQASNPKVPDLGNWLLFTPFLELMLVKDPEKRIKSKDLHGMLSDVEKFIEKQLKK